MDESRPLFAQLAEQIENDIISGVMAEETQVPSINEFAAFYRINPATALKGVQALVDEGALYKKRGIGMFVTPLLTEAAKLGISSEQLADMIRKAGK